MSLIPLFITVKSVLALNRERYIILVKAGGINLPIGIEEDDADAILFILVGGEFDKDLPSDLAANVLIALDVPLTKVVITELSGDEFLTRIYFQKDGEEISLPVFLGDGVVLGLGIRPRCSSRNKFLSMARRTKTRRPFFRSFTT